MIIMLSLSFYPKEDQRSSTIKRRVHCSLGANFGMLASKCSEGIDNTVHLLIVEGTVQQQGGVTNLIASRAALIPFLAKPPAWRAQSCGRW
jgi:hypothetical protein